MLKAYKVLRGRKGLKPTQDLKVPKVSRAYKEKPVLRAPKVTLLQVLREARVKPGLKVVKENKDPKALRVHPARLGLKV